MRGRKPTPTTLKKLRGNPGRRPLNDNEPDAPVTEKVPSVPANLIDDPAQNFYPRREWHRMAPILKEAGLLTKLDLRLLELYCVQYARWRQAEAEIARSGTVILSARHKQPMISPYLKVSRDAEQACHKILVEFGLSPSARSRVKVSKPEKPDEFELFLRDGVIPRSEGIE